MIVVGIFHVQLEAYVSATTGNPTEEKVASHNSYIKTSECHSIIDFKYMYTYTFLYLYI